MAAKDHLNPDQLRHLANKHGDKYYKNFRDPDKRQKGMCYEYSEHFSRYCKRANALVLAYDFDEDYPHAVNLVETSEGPHIVDFTYNQFDRNAQVPIVEPRRTYEERFKGRKIDVYPPYKNESDTLLH